MNQLAHVLQQWIDKRLASLVERPEIWGDRESVELQTLQLLEVRALVLDAARAGETLQRIQDSYVAFLSERFPDSPPVTLSQRLSEHADDGEFSSHLQEFIGRIIEEQGRTPKDSSLAPLRASRPSRTPAKRGIDRLRRLSAP